MASTVNAFVVNVRLAAFGRLRCCKKNTFSLKKKFSAIVFALLWVPPVFAQGAPQASNKAEWPRLKDGRVVIEVQDQKFAFTTTPYDLQYTQFNLDPKELQHLFPGDPLSINLDMVVKNPDQARKAFAAATQVNIPGSTRSNS